MTAVEARQKTNSIMDDKIRAALKEIHALITKTSTKGYSTIRYDIMHLEMVRPLKLYFEDLGYFVHEFCTTPATQGDVNHGIVGSLYINW